jgi:hypothetical protein
VVVRDEGERLLQGQEVRAGSIAKHGTEGTR